MTDESYYKYWALVALDDRDKGRSWGKGTFKECIFNLTMQRMK